MKLSIPSISFFQDGSVHHLYVSDRTILVHPNAEPLNNCGRIIVFSAILPYSCCPMLLRDFLELSPNKDVCYSTGSSLFNLGRMQHQLREEMLRSDTC